MPRHYFRNMQAEEARKRLLDCIAWEEKAQQERFRLDTTHTLRQLKAEGLALHPLSVTRRSFGYADYPEVQFRLPYPPGNHLFRDGAAIECFCSGEEPVRGVLLSLEGSQGEFRLLAPDFPDWLEEDGVGIKLAPDTRTTSIMRKCLEELPGSKNRYTLFSRFHATEPPSSESRKTAIALPGISFLNDNLNASQKEAVGAILENESLTIVHGPPGTGKTTTLVEAVRQLVKTGKKIAVSAPSNTAVDHLARGLIRAGIRVLRVGNLSKTDPELLAHTPEGRIQQGSVQKEIRQLRMRADEFRRMALRYRRQYGRDEREQRRLLFQEVRSLREEMKKLLRYEEEKMFRDAEVVAGTPIGLVDTGLPAGSFDQLIIDEAGQCMEPLAWCLFPLADKWVLAGDHWQLPPTVLSAEAAAAGFNISILERAIPHASPVYLLDTQYRMRPSLAGFSSQFFYASLLQTAAHLIDQGTHLVFVDTAGASFAEQPGEEGASLQNPDELRVVQSLLEEFPAPAASTAFISPYAAQVTAARNQLPASIRCSTIDSFQGQETDYLFLSLVRSNDDGQIGFLKDYRRMNVAITRAREKLYVVGDSATLGADPFYRAFLAYVEKNGSYRTVWELPLFG